MDLGLLSRALSRFSNIKRSFSNPADFIELVVFAGILATLGFAIFSWSLVFTCCGPHGVLVTSVISLLACYLFISHSLKSQGSRPLTRIVVGALNATAAIAIYEIIDGAAYLKLVDVYYAIYELPFLSGLFPGDSPIALLAGLGMVALLLLSGYEFMHANKWILIDIGIIALIFYLWISFGYPQFYRPGPGQQTGYLMNLVAKFPVQMFPATLYLEGKVQRRTPKNSIQ